jgi:nucleoid-associated protein EbfC
MNIQNLMAQAKKIQKELEETTKEIESTTFSGENDYIKVEIMGDYNIKKIDILKDEVLQDKEMLEDMLILATNSALIKIKNEKDSKLGKYTGGMGGLF